MLRRIALSLALAALLCGFAGCSGCNSHAEDIDQATKMTDAWLKLLDQGQYGEGWDQTGDQFKKLMAKEDWVKQIGAFRRDLGPIGTRTLESANNTSDKIPGLQPGQYVIIKYTTSFQHKAAALEQITAQKGEDGVWRSLGYYIR